MEIRDFCSKPFDLFNRGWALVTAGNEESFNTMTVSWGSMGTLWNKPIITVYVKPIRYTSEFLKREEFFTVSTYGNECKKALALLGDKSGRDCDKVSESGLTPLFLENGVTFEEAQCTFVCKKIYAAPFIAELVPEFAHEKYYTDEEEHIVFIGEVTEIIGGEKK
ncbi:MAG: flavin reductase [Oscillospiraceae bacterium]|nr:flavin reductase [Oscillospiraceae bacterium]